MTAWTRVTWGRESDDVTWGHPVMIHDGPARLTATASHLLHSLPLLLLLQPLPRKGACPQRWGENFKRDSISDQLHSQKAVTTTSGHKNGPPSSSSSKVPDHLLRGQSSPSNRNVRWTIVCFVLGRRDRRTIILLLIRRTLGNWLLECLGSSITVERESRLSSSSSKESSKPYYSRSTIAAHTHNSDFRFQIPTPSLRLRTWKSKKLLTNLEPQVPRNYLWSLCYAWWREIEIRTLSTKTPIAPTYFGKESFKPYYL